MSEVVPTAFVEFFVDELMPMKKMDIVEMIRQKTGKERGTILGYVGFVIKMFVEAGIIQKKLDEKGNTVLFPLM